MKKFVLFAVTSPLFEEAIIPFAKRIMHENAEISEIVNGLVVFFIIVSFLSRHND